MKKNSGKALYTKNSGEILLFIFLNSTKHAVVNGTTIMPGSIVITSPKDDDFLTFGEIKAILVTERQKILLCIYEYKTLGYCQHFHSWEIQKTSRKRILLCNNIITRQLLYPHVASVDNYFVTLKFAA